MKTTQMTLIMDFVPPFPNMLQESAEKQNKSSFKIKPTTHTHMHTYMCEIYEIANVNRGENELRLKIN